MALIEDPRKSVKEHIGEITRQEPDMDAKELAEREEAAKAYAGENEKHFVDYLEDCVTTSMNANEEVREVQDECWDLWNEKEPANYAPIKRRGNLGWCSLCRTRRSSFPCP